MAVFAVHHQDIEGAVTNYLSSEYIVNIEPVIRRPGSVEPREARVFLITGRMVPVYESDADELLGWYAGQVTPSKKKAKETSNA